MASLEIVALDTATPQLRAPGGTDIYAVPKDLLFSASGLGIYSNAVGGTGIQFDTGNFRLLLLGNTIVAAEINGGLAGGVSVNKRLGLSVGGGGGVSDVGFERLAAKVVKVSDGGTTGSSGAGVIQLPTFTVAGLPTAATAGAGARSTVSDGSVVAAGNFGTIVAGAGANIVPVYSDATNWRIG